MALEPRWSVLGDRNEWLVDTYTAVRDDWATVRSISMAPDTRTEYEYLREKDPWSMPLQQRAALFIYLNRVGFRGMFRVNREGRFNVPYGGKQGRNGASPETYAAAARVLQGAELRRGDFLDTLAGVTPADFVYFDPPYVDQEDAESFTAYTQDRFTIADQARLAAACRSLDRMGVRWALSNHDTGFVRMLYDGFRIRSFLAPRRIRPEKQQEAAEVLVTNY